MCHFLALGLREQHRAKAEHGIGRSAGFVLEPVVSPSVRAQFPETDAVFWVTDGHCSCDLLAHEPDPRDGLEEDLRWTQYRKLGWSESKVERAIASSRASVARNRGEELNAHFLSSLHALVKACGHVRLLVHEFSGLIDAEVVGPCERVVVPLVEFASGNGVLTPDTRIELTASWDE